jgi:hypothetical protein
MPMQELTEYIVRQLRSHRSRRDIAVALCEQHGMDWEQAEQLVLDTAIQHADRPNSLLWTLFLISGVFGLLFLIALFIVGILLVPSPIIRGLSPLSVQAGLAILAGGFVLCILILFLRSQRDNSIKETYRCPHCGYLANRRGDEASMWLPEFEAATHYTARNRLSTSHKSYKAGLEWDSFATFEITEYCRKCRQVRRTYREIRQVGAYRQERDNAAKDWR